MVSKTGVSAIGLVGLRAAVLVGVGGTAVGVAVDDCCIGIIADGIGSGVDVTVHAAATTTKEKRVMTSWWYLSMSFFTAQE